MPNSRFALHGKRPSLIHGLCAFFASNSRFMRLFQAALDTPLDSPFSATLSVHGLFAFELLGISNFRPRLPGCLVRFLSLVVGKRALFQKNPFPIPILQGLGCWNKKRGQNPKSTLYFSGKKRPVTQPNQQCLENPWLGSGQNITGPNFIHPHPPPLKIRF